MIPKTAGAFSLGLLLLAVVGAGAQTAKAKQSGMAASSHPPAVRGQLYFPDLTAVVNGAALHSILKPDYFTLTPTKWRGFSD